MVDLTTLRQFFGIKPDAWDVIIVTDGSATTWEKEGGWGAVVIKNDSFIYIPFFGGMSHCTNNVAELMAVLHPLMFLASNKGGVNPKGCRVHVISDSEYVVKGLKQTNIAWAQELKNNREMWMAIHMTRRKGMIFTSHHIHRDTIELNRICHDLANLGRRSQIKLVDKLERDIDGAI